MDSRAPVSAFRGFSTALSSAVLEWILMFLLFFYASFAYLVTKFSRICKLQPPCMLCSRLDHIFGNESPGFYMNLICETHRVEISKLAIIGNDRKLVDTYALFQDFILTHASGRNSNSVSCKALNGKVGGHFDDFKCIQSVDDDDDDSFHEFYENDTVGTSFLKKDIMLRSTRLLEDKSTRANITEGNISLLNSAEHSHVQSEDGVRKTKENSLVSPKNNPLTNQASDSFSHVGYSEVKTISDSDSEVSLEENDEKETLTNEEGDAMDSFILHNEESESILAPKSTVSDSYLDDKTQEELNHSASVSTSEDKVLEKLISFTPVIDEHSITTSYKKTTAGELPYVSTFSSSSVGTHTMFEDRLQTLASKSKANTKTYKSLNDNHFDDTGDVQGVDGDDSLSEFHGNDLASAPLLKKDFELHAIWSSEDKSLRSTVTDIDIPLSSSACHSHLQSEDAMRETSENTPVSPKYHLLSNEEFDRFSHVVYSEVKITSDSDSEVPLQDDNDETESPTNENVLNDLISHNVESESATTSNNNSFSSFLDELAPEESIRSDLFSISDEKAVEKLITSPPVIQEPSEINPNMQINVGKIHNISSFSSSSVDNDTVFKDGLRTLASERKSTPENHDSLNDNIDGHSDNHEDIQGVDGDDRLHDFQGDDLDSTPFLKKVVNLQAISSLKDESIRATVTDIDIPFLSSGCHSHIQSEDAVRERSENTLVSPKYQLLCNEDFDRFSHVGYTEVKINSDSDSEVPLKDDDERKSHCNEDENFMDDSGSDSTRVVNNFLSGDSVDNGTTTILVESSAVSISDEKALDKLIDFTSVIDELSEAVLDRQINVGECGSTSVFSSSCTAGHCLDDSSLNKSETADPPQVEFGPQEYQEVPLGDPDEKDDLESIDAAFLCATDDDKIGDASETDQSTDNHMSSNGTYQVAVTEGSLRTPRFIEIIMGNNSCSVQEDLKSEPGQSINNHMDPNDAYKLAVGTKGRPSSPRSTEVTMRNGSTIRDDLKRESDQSITNHFVLNDDYKFAISTTGSLSSPRFELTMVKDSSEVQEDLNLLISQWTEMSPSPREYGQVDEFVFRNITESLSPERNDSGVESLDGSIVSEVEGESTFERLKRQVDLDKKSINLLYRELEEERNASAIAANQSMAMINRLQEEKAAMQMEALQYLRMMEEQAEYDQQALQKCNELLTLREQEIFDLEAELESFRKSFADDFSVDKTVEQNGHLDDMEIAFCKKSLETGSYRWSRQGTLNNPLCCFEDEKSYILNCLRKIENKLHLFSNNGNCDNRGSIFNLSDGNENGFPEKLCAAVHGEDCIERNIVLSEGGLNCQYDDVVAVSDSEQFHLKDGHSKTIQTGDNILSEEKLPKKGSSSAEVNHDVSSCMQLLKVGNKSELVSLENEISCLCQRVMALEADRDFLEHAISYLRNGSDGVQFIQEIACDLRELRRICFTKRDHLAA